MDYNLLNGNAPLGFGMALGQNLKAMEQFTLLPPEKRKQVLERTSNIQSKDEMRAFTDSIAAGNVLL